MKRYSAITFGVNTPLPGCALRTTLVEIDAEADGSQCREGVARVTQCKLDHGCYPFF
jgi:hypothetical protein